MDVHIGNGKKYPIAFILRCIRRDNGVLRDSEPLHSEVCNPNATGRILYGFCSTCEVGAVEHEVQTCKLNSMYQVCVTRIS